MSEWKCYIKQDMFSLQTHLYIVRSTGNYTEYLHFEGGSIMNTEAKRGEEVKPLLILSDMLARELFTAISEALDQSGFKPESNAKIEGTLAATKDHLSDLRQLLKLK